MENHNHKMNMSCQLALFLKIWQIKAVLMHKFTIDFQFDNTTLPYWLENGEKVNDCGDEARNIGI